MPARQQRAIYNRRRTSLNAPPLLPVAIPVLLGISPSFINIVYKTQGPPPDLVSEPQRMVIGAVPQVIRTADGNVPTAMFVSGDNTEVRLDFGGAPLDPGETFSYPANDPGARLASGGWVAPALLGASSPPAPTVGYTAAQTAPTEVTLTLIDAVTADLVCDAMLFTVTVGPFTRTVVSAAWDAASLVLTMDDTVGTPADIRYTGDRITGGAESQVQLTLDPVPLT